MTAQARAAAWEHAPCGLATMHVDGTLVDVNRSLLRWAGREAPVRVGDLLSVGSRIYWETHLSPLLRVEGGIEDVALELATAGGRRPVLVVGRRRR